jgi:pimeloyl-ACP methyl ester carboxylesterase
LSKNGIGKNNVQSTVLKIKGLRYRVLHEGLEKEGRPTLLVQGLGSNARVWELVAERLLQSGLRPVCPDLRGHGLSDKPEGGYDFAGMSSDLAALIQELDLQQPLIVGHSWGAVLAVEYAARFADHDAGPGGIVLVDGGMAQLDDYPGATWELARQTLTPPRWAGMRVEDFIARLRDPSRAWQPDDRSLDTILASFEITEQGKIYPHMPFERYMQIIEMLWEFRNYERFEKIRCPALMLPVRPPKQAPMREQVHATLKQTGIERARAIIETLRVHWIEDAVHDVLLQKPEELASQIVDFERSLPPPT